MKAVSQQVKKATLVIVINGEISLYPKIKVTCIEIEVELGDIAIALGSMCCVVVVLGVVLCSPELDSRKRTLSLSGEKSCTELQTGKAGDWVRCCVPAAATASWEFIIIVSCLEMKLTICTTC